MINLHLQALSLFYMILVLIVFHTKKNIKNLETDIYKALIWIDLVGIIIDIVLIFFGYYNPYHYLAYFLNKCYMTYIVLWAAFFSFYIFKISLTRTQAQKYRNIVNFLYFVTTLIEVILTFAFEVKLYNKDGVMYSYGSTITSAAIFAFVHVIAIIFIIIKNRKNLTLKKYIPILVLILMCLIGFAMRLLNPGLLLTTTVITFITVLMYFTIENPDIKMLEEFKIAKDRAERANKEKEVFLYNITQDVRMPLNNIKRSSSWINDNLDEITKNDIKEGMFYINTNASTVLDKVNNVLDITNMEITNIKVYNKKYDIKLLLDELSKIYNARVDQKVKLLFNIDSNIPIYLDGDSLRLKQLLTIILDNSVKYTEKGYIELTLNTIVKKNICRLVISIEDTGCGIKSSDIDEIFNKNNQKYNSLDKIDDSKKNLAIAKSIATLLGGVLMLESEIGRGTEVTIILDQKIYDEKSTELKKIENNVSSYITKSKVMIISEDSEYLENATRKLDNYQIEVIPMDLASKGLEYIRLNKECNLIIIDEELRHLSALEVIEKFKGISGFDVDVAILTNNIENNGYLKNGFKYILNRKLDKAELDKLIEGIE